MAILERYIAIDNVCAWPQALRLADGRIGVALFNQPTHGRWEGTVDFHVSSDDGRTWAYAGTPVPHAPGTNRMNHAVGQARNGDLVVLVAGYGNRPAPGQPPLESTGNDALPPLAALSSDGGVTWRPAGPIPVATPERNLTPFGPIVALANGQLLASFYDWPADPAAPKVGRSLLYRSFDHGQSWQYRACISAENVNETCLYAVNDQRLLAAVRTCQHQTLHLYVSEDAGDTWSMHGHLAGDYEHNGHLLRLPDGRILLTYGVRHPHDLALACRVSPDDGRTWRRPHRLLQIDDTERYDGGYPSSVLVGEDQVLTVYYARRCPSHHRYHMGAVLWNWREEFNHGFDRA